MADTAFLVLVILSILLNILVYTPILVYWMYKIVKYRNSFVIKKRLPTLLVTLITLSIIYFSIEKSIQLFTIGHILSPASKLTLNKIIFYVFQIPFIYFLWFYALRFWLLYYKLEWSLSMMNNEWKSIIHHNNASDDWFIIHRQQYGSLRYLQKKLIIIVSTITVFVLLAWILYWENTEPNGIFVWIMYITFVFGPPTTVLFYVAYKLPHYDDYLALKDELKYSCYGFVIVIFILILFFAIINAAHGLSSSPYLQLLLWHVVVLWNFTMITLHTYWVLKRFDNVLRRKRYSDASLFSDINKVVTDKDKQSNGHSTNGSTHSQKHSKHSYKLQMMLKHPKSYDLFMHHLWKEHSSECLLSGTEFIQFQYLITYHNQCLSNCDIDGIIETELDGAHLSQLHPDIPQSSIVFGTNPTNKISQFMIRKLNIDSHPLNTMHKKSIFSASQKLAQNITHKIAKVVSPNKLYYQQQLNNGNGSDKPILGMSEPNGNHRIRHSVSDVHKHKIKKSKKTKKKRHSVSDMHKPLPIIDKKKGGKHKKNASSHSAFQIDNINMHDLLQGIEPVGSPPVPNDNPTNRNNPYYEKPIKPQNPAPLLPLKNAIFKNGSSMPAFTQMASSSVDNGSDTTDNDNDGSVVVNEYKNNTYSGIPIMACDDTPTLKSQYIDPNEPPLPPLKPLPQRPTLSNQNQSKSEAQNSVSIAVRHGQKRAHKRTLSLRDRINGLVNSASLRSLRAGSTHRRTQSNQIVFSDIDNDNDSLCTDDELDSDDEDEDSVVVMYKGMSRSELEQRYQELIVRYRAIAYDLWVKYIRVGSEYEINIDYNTRRRFAGLMGNREEWIKNEMFGERELEMLFHGCVQKMFTFLSNSFTRFKDKPDFDRVQEFLLI